MQLKNRLVVFTDRDNFVVNESTKENMLYGKNDIVTFIECKDNIVIVMHCLEEAQDAKD